MLLFSYTKSENRTEQVLSGGTGIGWWSGGDDGEWCPGGGEFKYDMLDIL
jgi:hypothetical protein